MNTKRILTSAIAISGIVMLVLLGVAIGNKHYLMDAYHEEIDLDSGDVPDWIHTDLEKRHPEATNIIWELDDKLYEAEFFFAGRKTEVYYSEEGWWKTERDISFEKLPDVARQIILQESGTSYRIGNVEAVELLDSPVKWEVELESRLYEWDYSFDAAGELISKNRDG